MFALAAIGIVLWYREDIVRDPVLSRRLSVVGATSAGVFACWFVTSIVRSSVVLSLSPSASFTDFALGPIFLYGFEAWFLAAGLLFEARTSLGGRYHAKDEWLPSFIDGLGMGAIIVVVCTAVSFPIWWMIRPGDYGKFGGSPVGIIVGDRLTEAFESDGIIGTASELAAIEQRKALIHAILMAPFATLLIPILYRCFQFSRRELTEEYEHRYRVPDSESGSDSLLFPPRGGGLN